MTLQPSGTYVIQNAGNNSYLGCGATISVLGDALVGVNTTPGFQWELQSVGGFAWSWVLPQFKLYGFLTLILFSLHLPKTTFSVGFADYEVEDGDEVSFL